MLKIKPFCNFSQTENLYKELKELDEKVLKAVGSVYDSSSWTEAQFRYHLPQKEQLSMAAVLEEKLVGFSIGYAFLPHWHHISRVAVHPDFTGKAIAKTLLSTQLSEMVAHHPALITVDTKKENEAALRLYVGLGFSRLETSELENYVQLRHREPEEYLGETATHFALINRKNPEFKLTTS